MAQVLAYTEILSSLLCIDRERVYGVGSSNGGMFQFELAQDPRTAPLFAAHASLVGLPHPGWNLGPLVSPTPFIGFWGSIDDCVPPRCAESAGSFSPASQESCLSTCAGGWWYVTAERVAEQWAANNSCDAQWEEYAPPAVAAYMNSSTGSPVNCSQAVGCAAGGEVVQCFFAGGHSGPRCEPAESQPCYDALFHIAWNFLRGHRRPGARDNVTSAPINESATGEPSKIGSPTSSPDVQPTIEPPATAPAPESPSVPPAVLAVLIIAACLTVVALAAGSIFWVRRHRTARSAGEESDVTADGPSGAAYELDMHTAE